MISNEIKNNRPLIAKAIASAYGDGDKASINGYYKDLMTSFENSEIFIYDTELPKINTYRNNLVTSIDTVKRKYRSIIKFEPQKYNSQIDDECLEFFKKNKPLLQKFEISPFIFYHVYLQNKHKELIQELKILNHKSRFFKLKLRFDRMFYDLTYKATYNELMEFQQDYKLENIYDLLNFKNQLDCFFIDTTSLSNEEKQYINNQKKKALKHFSKYTKNNIKEIKHTHEQLNNLLNSYYLKNTLSNINIKSFIYSNKHAISIDNLNSLKLSFERLDHLNIAGLANIYGNSNFAFFKNTIVKECAKTQNDVIIHEHIHLYDDNDLEFANYVNKYCPLINEYLTEYLTRKALNYLEKNILSTSDEEAPTRAGYVTHTHLELACGPEILEILLKAKINRDFVLLDEKIGKKQLKIINESLIKNKDMYDVLLALKKERNQSK